MNEITSTAVPSSTVADPAPTLLRWAVALAAVNAVGLALLAIGHAGLDVPLLSELGPGGGRAVPPAAAAFTVGAAAWAAVAAALARRRRWAWALGIVVGALGALGGVGQFRGIASAVGIALSVAVVALLLVPSVRSALR